MIANSSLYVTCVQCQHHAVYTGQAQEQGNPAGQEPGEG